MRVKLLKWFALAALIAMVLSACTAPAGTTSPSKAPAPAPKRRKRPLQKQQPERQRVLSPPPVRC